MENPIQSRYDRAEHGGSKAPSVNNPPDRLGALVAIVALTYPVAYTYVYFVGVAGAPQIVQQVVYSGGKVLQFAMPLLWIGWLWLKGMRIANDTQDAPLSLGRSLAIALGFSLPTVAVIGVAGGLWLLPAGYLDVAGREIREKILHYGITTPLRYALLGFFYSVIHSYLEEYYWRWFAFRQLRRLTPLAPAAIISGIAFAAHHVLVLGLFFGWGSPLAWLAGVSVAVGGAFWAWLYERSGRLWMAWLSHMVIDIGVFGMGYWMILAK
ncbi:MAG: CPBP family intramembrane metalloprotease [Planctomycetes bacterium]|nr:CPBP family intramembrane metalloprotease [Planctomycetota bacterium]